MVMGLCNPHIITGYCNPWYTLDGLDWWRCYRITRSTWQEKTWLGWSCNWLVTTEKPGFLKSCFIQSNSSGSFSHAVGHCKFDAVVLSENNPPGHRPSISSNRSRFALCKVRLMDKIPNNHLGWLKTLYINNGIIIILGGAGFCPSTVSD